MEKLPNMFLLGSQRQAVYDDCHVLSPRFLHFFFYGLLSKYVLL